MEMDQVFRENAGVVAAFFDCVLCGVGGNWPIHTSLVMWWMVDTESSSSWAPGEWAESTLRNNSI